MNHYLHFPDLTIHLNQSGPSLPDVKLHKFMCVKEINFSVLSSRDVIVSGPHPPQVSMSAPTHTHTHTSPSSEKSNLGFEKDLLSQGSDVYCPKVCDFLSHYFSDV